MLMTNPFYFLLRRNRCFLLLIVTLQLQRIVQMALVSLVPLQQLILTPLTHKPRTLNTARPI
jgi:hypothetical protein